MRLQTLSYRGAVRPAAGLSIVELLISLAITAMLLTATMVAIDASFYAYASAAESASTQTTTRLAVHRLNALIRTSSAHGPLEAGLPASGTEEHRVWSLMKGALDAALQADASRSLSNWAAEAPVMDDQDPENILHSSYLWLRSEHLDGDLTEDYLLVYLRQLDELWLVRLRDSLSGGEEVQAQPLLGGISQQLHEDAYIFTVRRREMRSPEDTAYFVLERGHLDMRVLPSQDASLAVENTRRQEPLRVIASTVPRRLN